MTQDEIIEMARQSDLGFLLGDSWLMHDEIKHFAKLVADKAVRESSAEYRLGWNDGQIAEREACALICEELKYDGYEMVKDNPTLARKIRARGLA
jgi:hypothetical protein